MKKKSLIKEVNHFQKIAGLIKENEGAQWMSKLNPEVNGTGTILDGDYIKTITLTWGPNWNSAIVGNGLFGQDRPLASNPGPASPEWISWLGVKETMSIPADSHVAYFRGWKIGALI